MKPNRSDKYRTMIEGEERFFRYVDEALDHIQTTVHFEVDWYDTRINLKALNKHESLSLRDDCVVTRV